MKFCLVAIFLLCCILASSHEAKLEKLVSSLLFDYSKKKPMSFPGTKWCGSGNTSAEHSDLGAEKETDTCCRTHDECHDSIKSQHCKHGLKNNRPFPSFHCECESKFYDCLKSTNTNTSKKVGQLYFTVFGDLGAQCFNLEHPSTCNKFEPSLKGNRCAEYAYNQEMPKKYQWFDFPVF